MTEPTIHQKALKTLCRICGQRCLKQPKAKTSHGCPKETHKDRLLVQYGIDVLPDNPDIHPSFICLCCIASLSRKRNRTVIIWEIHDDFCKACSLFTTTIKGGRRAKPGNLAVRTRNITELKKTKEKRIMEACQVILEDDAPQSPHKKLKQVATAVVKKMLQNSSTVELPTGGPKLVLQKVVIPKVGSRQASVRTIRKRTKALKTNLLASSSPNKHKEDADIQLSAYLNGLSTQELCQLLKKNGLLRIKIPAGHELAMKARFGWSWREMRHLKAWLKQYHVTMVSEAKTRQRKKEILGGAIHTRMLPFLFKEGEETYTKLAPISCIPQLTQHIMATLDELDRLDLLTWDYVPIGNIYIKIGGDHGGGSTKFFYEIVNVSKPNSITNTTVFCVYEADESLSNMHIALDPFVEQINALSEENWRGMPIDVWICGDYEIERKLLGLQGASATYPCTVCHVKKEELSSPEDFEARTLTTIEDDYNEVERQNHSSESKRTNHSVSSKPFFQIPVAKVCPPGLHISLGLWHKFYKNLERDLERLGKLIAEDKARREILQCIMGEQHQMWKVFFPQCCLETPSGICLGWTCIEKRLICVLAIAKASLNDKDISDLLSRHRVELVGVWESNDGFDQTSVMLDCPFNSASVPILRLKRCGTYDDAPPVCQLEFVDQDGGVRSTSQNILFILYDQRQLSAARTDQWSTHLSRTNKQTHCRAGCTTSDDSLTDIERVCLTVQNSRTSTSALKSEGYLTISCDVLSENDRTLSRTIGRLMWGLICMQLKPSFAVINFLIDSRICHSRAVQWLVRFPATGCQLIQRFSTLQRLQDTVGYRRHSMECKQKQQEVRHQDTEIKQRRGNILCSVAVDVCLGIVLMLWLQHNNIPVAMAEWLLIWANTTGEQLQQLLQWLMGNPAGLKLNSALAHFLGHFFLYHVYLWIGYLTVIGPFLSMLIWCMALSGCLGLSVLLSVASDMLSILTFHIYCFYVYAAKIYSMQMSGLLSLSRLFRGKKWNVLRRRVDSCAYDKDQLFIGTLLFTMLLFLLPTTALFYIVFTMLRLVVLIIQSVLTKLVHLLNTLPVFSIILWATNSETLTDGVEFHVKEQLNGRPPYLVMHVQSMSLSRVLRIGQTSFYDDAYKGLETPRKTIVDLGKDLLRGHLIYPWGGESREKRLAKSKCSTAERTGKE